MRPGQAGNCRGGLPGAAARASAIRLFRHQTDLASHVLVVTSHGSGTRAAPTTRVFGAYVGSEGDFIA